MASTVSQKTQWILQRVIMAARESNRGEVTKIIYLRDHLAKYTFYRRNYGYIRVQFEYRAYSYSSMPGNSSWHLTRIILPELYIVAAV